MSIIDKEAVESITLAIQKIPDSIKTNVILSKTAVMKTDIVCWLVLFILFSIFFGVSMISPIDNDGVMMAIRVILGVVSCVFLIGFIVDLFDLISFLESPSGYITRDYLDKILKRGD